MFESDLEKFVAKRVAACLELFCIVAIILLPGCRPILAGLLIGAVLSVLSFCANAWFFRTISCRGIGDEKKQAFALGIFAFTSKGLILFLLLFAAYAINPRLFAGMTAGALLAPFAIILNIITESLGVTKNRFFI